jgi:hypothetical protein
MGILFATFDQKKELVTYSKITDNVPKYDNHCLSNIVPGDDSCFHYFLPVCESYRRIWATKMFFDYALLRYNKC